MNSLFVQLVKSYGKGENDQELDVKQKSIESASIITQYEWLNNSYIPSANSSMN